METVNAEPAVGAGREAWLRAGQELLRRGGIGAVKIHALKGEAGLTTGSFYHHFAGMDGYLEDLARYWGQEFLDANVSRIRANGPRDRLAEFSRVALDDRLRSLDAAMRDWAGSSEIAAESVRRTDEVLLTEMRDAFVELGFSDADARLRAQLYLCSGVARVMSPWRPSADDVDRVLDLLAGPASAAGVRR
ncbi:MAG: TetR/AcrR family transcriptional regulator [Actinomycetota bacterium]